MTRIISFNANGIRAAFRKGFQSFLSEQEADIICLQELKAHTTVIPEIASYQRFWHPAKRKGYSGVGILSKEKPDAVKRGMGIADYDEEGRVIRADFGDVSVLSVYVPSGSSQSKRQIFKMRFLEDFKAYTARLLVEDRELIICGDFNIAHKKIDLKNWRSNQKTSGFLPEERAWLDNYLSLGMVDAYREHIGPEAVSYSWWSLRTGARARNVGWRLDYQLTTPKLANAVKNSSIPMVPNLSDHAPVIMDYRL